MNAENKPGSVRNGINFEAPASYDKEEVLAKASDDVVKSYICELYAQNQYNKELIRNLCREKKKAVADKKKLEEENADLKETQSSNSSQIAVLKSERDRLQNEVGKLETFQKETEKKNDELREKNVQLRETNSLVTGTNRILRRELKEFYKLAVVASICFAGADILSDWSIDWKAYWLFLVFVIIATVIRLVGIVIICCEARIARSSVNNKKQTDASSKPDVPRLSENV